MPTVHLIIKGRVQGVYFRATAKDVADEFGVTGWVKNTEEGNVEITASGTEDQLRRFIAWSKSGPPRAMVTDVVIADKKEEKFESFRIIRKPG
jgi:acylphosphatase